MACSIKCKVKHLIRLKWPWSLTKFCYECLYLQDIIHHNPELEQLVMYNQVYGLEKLRPYACIKDDLLIKQAMEKYCERRTKRKIRS